jgi:signal transduction histidine kinase
VEPQLASPAGRLPAPVEIVLYRVAQEALSNVAKHAQASLVRLELAVSERRVQLVVVDNGRGFLPGQQRRSVDGGLGLLGMAERIQALRGELRITSTEGTGTRVEVELPAADNAAATTP